MTPTMDWLVSLRYPDGQIHETRVSGLRTLHPGFEFSAFGRRWRVVEAQAVTRDDQEAELMVCDCVGHDNRTLAGRLNERAEWTGQTA